MSNADTVASFNNAVGDVNSGKTDVDDFTYSYWYKSNWGDMLVPAPMAVSIMAQLALVATAADFKLVAPTGGFKYVKWKDSFRSTILQLVDEGANGLQASYRDMDIIAKRCAGIKPGVNNIVQLLMGTDGQSDAENVGDIKRYLPSQLSQLQDSVKTCLAKAQEMDDSFADLLNLTMEIHESCTATQGDNEAKIKDAQMRQSILEAQKSAAQESKDLEKKHLDEATKAYDDSQKQFQKAADSMPSGWDLVGMQFVEGLSKAVLTGVNAGINRYMGASQNSTAQQNNAIAQVQGGNVVPPKQSAINPPSSYDPGYQKAECLRLAATSLHHIGTEGPNGGVDWTSVDGSGNTGLAWTKGTMETSLGTSFGDDQPSATAKTLLQLGVQLCDDLDGLKATKPDAQIQAVVAKINDFAFKATQFATDAQLKTNTAAMQSPGLDQPVQQPIGGDDSAASIAVKNAQFRLDSAGKQLDANRDAYDKSTEKMLEVTKALGDIMGQLAGLNMQTVEWDKIRAILIQAIAFLCQLKGCLSDLVHYFQAVNTTIQVSMGTSMTNLITLINDSTKDVSLAGVSLSNFGKQAIYTQSLSAAKIGRLVQDISQLYVTMYDQHVQEGVTMLLGMNSAVKSEDAKDVVAANGRKIGDWATRATNGIHELLQTQQSKFESDVNARTEELKASIQGILPKPSAAITQAVSAATDLHKEEVNKQLDAATQAKPVYNTAKLKRMMV